MTCSIVILEKRSRETRRYDVNVYVDTPKAATVSSILDVIVDPLADADIEALGSNYLPIAIDAPGDWVINAAPITYNDGRQVPAGKVMQGSIGGGNHGYTYTIRVLYARSDDAGPHEATVLLEVNDTIV